MNIYQKLLFARVGFTPHALQLLCLHREHKEISDRTARYWTSGEVEPKNEYYTNCAEALDAHLTNLAQTVINEHTRERIILPYYSNDDEYWTATDDIPCPVSVYHQLLQRITILSDKPVHFLLDPNRGLDDDDYNLSLREDWDNYIQLSIGFDF